MVLLDTGPLVAYLNSRDQHHSWAVEQFRICPAPYYTCEAVLTETDHLLEKANVQTNVVFEALRSGALKIGFSVAEDWSSIERLKNIYKDVPISLADACLVRMAELNDGAKVMTLDSDFRVYRKHRRHVIPLISNL